MQGYTLSQCAKWQIYSDCDAPLWNTLASPLQKHETNTQSALASRPSGQCRLDCSHVVQSRVEDVICLLFSLSCPKSRPRRGEIGPLCCPPCPPCLPLRDHSREITGRSQRPDQRFGVWGTGGESQTLPAHPSPPIRIRYFAISLPTFTEVGMDFRAKEHMPFAHCLQNLFNVRAWRGPLFKP
jgi:hypothetical protein